MADQPPADADVRHQLQALTDVLAAAEDRLDERVVVAQVEEHLLDLLVDRRRQQRQRLGARLLGSERRIVAVGAQDGVHLTGRRAEGADTGQQALRVVEREHPAVARLADVLLQDPERRVHELARVLIPAGKSRDVRKVAQREEAQHLELGVDPRLQAAKDLQHELVAVDERRVGLLGTHRAHGAARRAAAVEGDAVDRDLAAEQVAEHALGSRLTGQQLVELAHARCKARLDEVDREARPVGELDVLEHVHARDLARLGRKPALLDDPLVQRPVDDVGQAHRSSPSSRNQKKPRGASVSR